MYFIKVYSSVYENKIIHVVGSYALRQWEKENHHLDYTVYTGQMLSANYVNIAKR